jgi:RsiW-degrading membrane proteinase PrsW (M82 family)
MNTMRKPLQTILAAGGMSAILISLLHITMGPASIPGSIPVNATMDSEDRFFATLLTAFGAALLWCVRDVEKKSCPVYFLALTFFGGGLARLVSMLAAGLPHPLFIGMTLLELGLPPIVWWMISRVSTEAHRPLYRHDRRIRR